MKIEEFIKGHIYNREDLRSAFKGSFMRGMNKCNETNTLVLISKHTSNRIYGDLFRNNQLIYTGEGRTGNQSYKGANKDLLNSESTNLPVYLFVVFKKKQYTYYGQVHLCGDPYFEYELDVKGNDRKVIRFPLILSNDFIPLTTEQMKNHYVAGIVSEKKTLQVVGAAIINEKGEVLCAQRGYGSLKGKWEFPGGKIEKGESDAEALAREIKEELGIKVEVKEMVDENYHEYDSFNVNLKVYKCQYIAGEINDTEHQSLKWVEGKKLGELDWADADKPVVDTYLDSLPRTIDGEPLQLKYYEAKAIESSDRELLRAVQDYERAQRNQRKAGESAEQAVINYEKDKLNNAGRPDLADMVKQVSKQSSDYGYDILSFEINNGVAQEVHIEVKSAKMSNSYIEFFISENELNKFKNDAAYKVYCLIRMGRNYKLHEVNKTDFFMHNYLSPMSYRVRIRIAD